MYVTALNALMEMQLLYCDDIYKPGPGVIQKKKYILMVRKVSKWPNNDYGVQPNYTLHPSFTIFYLSFYYWYDQNTGVESNGTFNFTKDLF